MAKIKPFKGVRPPREMVTEVASRPYDVLNSEEARTEAEGNPKSLYHIIKPEIDFAPGTDEHDSCVYDRAVENFNAFQQNGWLVQDNEEHYYIYAQTMDGRTQYGIVVAANVEDYMTGRIKKHELTRRDKEEDRMKHVRINNANIEPVFFAFPDNPALEQIIKDVTAEKIVSIKQGIYVAGAWIIAILMIISLVIVSNTIRVTMYNRKLEISIMKVVGATNSFVRIPFVIEGIVLGIISALISECVVYFCYRVSTETMRTALSADTIVSFSSVAWLLLGMFVLIGVIAGMVGSAIMINKYLRKEGSLGGLFMARTSDKAERILEFVNQFVQENGFAPSVREIGAAVGLRSTASVSYHIQALQEKGLLLAPGGKGRKRSIVTNVRPGQIPVVGVVTAGVPILAVENQEGTMAWDGESGCFALRVRGDSMINAGILSGDKVVVRPQQTADDGQIVVARIGD